MGPSPSAVLLRFRVRVWGPSTPAPTLGEFLSSLRCRIDPEVYLILIAVRPIPRMLSTLKVNGNALMHASINAYRSGMVGLPLGGGSSRYRLIMNQVVPFIAPNHAAL